jgi:hypothetical protein
MDGASEQIDDEGEIHAIVPTEPIESDNIIPSAFQEIFGDTLIAG